MKIFLIVSSVLLVIIDIMAYIRLRKIFKEHAIGDKAAIPAKDIMPYVITMSVISVVIPVITLIVSLI